MFSVHTTPEEFKNGRFTPKTPQMFSVHTTPEEFENGGFTPKTNQMFSVHTEKRRFHSANASNVFCPHCIGRLGFEENSVRKIT